MSNSSALPPPSLQALFAQAVTAHEQGRMAPAREGYQAILAAAPDQPDALHMFGILHIQTGQADEGLVMIGRALALRPGFFDAHLNRGAALVQLGRPADAAADFAAAAALQPAHAGAALNLAAVSLELGRAAEALAAFDRVLALQAQNPDALGGRAVALSRLDRWSEALAAFDAALGLRPGDGDLLAGRGAALAKLDRVDEAVTALDAALERAPNHLEARVNRGAVRKRLGQAAAALADAVAALKIEPGHVEALTNRALALHALGRFDEALGAFDQALAIEPQSPLAGFNKSLTLLLTGRLAEGWPLYERRFDLFGAAAFPHRATMSAPVWNGRDALSGKTLLVQAEQGLGDTIQFCRFAPLAADRGARVVLSAPAALGPLLARLDPRVQPADQAAPPPACDYHCALMSLPGLLDVDDRAKIPGAGGYLAADATLATAWAQRLGPRRRRRIGLAWAGAAANPEDAARSIALAALVPLLGDHADWYCLHHQIRETDRAALDTLPQLSVFDPADMDFANTAALIANVDLVISVDTSLAHLAAALGKPVWVLLPYIPDWRWGLGAETTPWYRSARLFRQAAPGDWAGVIGEVKRELSAKH